MTANFIHPIRVYYEDTDAGGVVYYANYLKFFERARTEWLRHLGYEQDQLRDQGVLFVVSEAHLKYLKGARFNAMLEVVSSVSDVRRACLIFSQFVRDAEDPNLIYCHAKVTVASIGENFKPCPLPFEWPTEVSESP